MSENRENSAFYTARPQIAIDGEINSGLGLGLLALEVRETRDGLASCEATFTNWGPIGRSLDFLYFRRDILDFGKNITIRLGELPNDKLVFNGRIMALEAVFPQAGSPALCVLAEDRFQDLRMRRRSRTFEDNSDEDVFRQIASEHGLQSDLDITGPQHRTLAQVNQSDLAFLRDRARAIDAETWIEESTLHAVARARRETDTVTLSYGQSLHEFSVCADLAQQQTTFTASGWDVDAKETLQHDASDSILGSELNGDLSGSAILQQAVGTRTQTIVHQTPATAEETRFYAEAHFREHARQFVTGTAKCEGNPNIRVGTKLTLNGLGDLFNGNYYVNEAIHTYDLRQGYATMFRVERCGIGQSS